MIKAILFDIDGTLLDTREFIIQAYLHTIQKHGKIVYDKTELMTFINGTIFEVYERALPGFDLQPLVDEHEAFQTANLDLITAYDDVHATFDALSREGIQIAALTNRRKKSAHTNLKLHNLDVYFKLVLTPEDLTRGKPDPEGVQKALKYFKINKHEIAMVGDAVTDIETGKNAGVKTVGVTHGFSSRAQLKEAGADFIIDALPELVTHGIL